MRKRSQGSRDKVLVTAAALLGTGGLLWLLRRWLAPQLRGQLSPADRRFIDEAIASGQEEVELGYLAQQRTQNDDVRRFAQTMVRDHSQAGSELRDLSFKKGHVPPTSLPPQHRAVVGTLGRSCGPDFDRPYVNTMVDLHRQAVALFQREAGSGDDPDLRAWARKTVGTLQEHLQMALRLQDQLRQHRRPEQPDQSRKTRPAERATA